MNIRIAIGSIVCVMLLSVQCAYAQSPLNVACSYYRTGDYKAAIPYFRAARVQSIQPDIAIFYEAICHRQTGNSTACLELMKELETHYPQSVYYAQAVKLIGRRDANSKDISISTNIRTPAQQTIREKVPCRDVCGHVCIRVEVNNKTIELPVDTGATATTISRVDFPDVIKDDQLRCASPVMINTAMYGPIDGQEIELAISVGKVRRTERVFIVDKPDLSVLGQSFFKDLEIEITKAYVFMRQKQAPSLTASAPSKWSLPYETEQEIIVVEATINDKPCKVYFDTGCAVSGIVCPTSIYRYLGLHGAQAKVVLGPINKWGIAIQPVDMSIKRPLVGPSFFGDRHYTIDPVNKMIHFQY